MRLGLFTEFYGTPVLHWPRFVEVMVKTVGGRCPHAGPEKPPSTMIGVLI